VGDIVVKNKVVRVTYLSGGLAASHAIVRPSYNWPHYGSCPSVHLSVRLSVTYRLLRRKRKRAENVCLKCTFVPFLYFSIRFLEQVVI